MWIDSHCHLHYDYSPKTTEDLVREALRADPHRRVILLGAGFDTRAFRLTGGRCHFFTVEPGYRLRDPTRSM